MDLVTQRQVKELISENLALSVCEAIKGWQSTGKDNINECTTDNEREGLNLVDIVIPSCKELDQIAGQIQHIKSLYPCNRIIPVCGKRSAAENRNLAHGYVTARYAIMMDDDISGFFQGFVERLTAPLTEDPNIALVSARLTKQDGKTPNHMMASKLDLSGKTEEVSRIPTSCFAYRKRDLDALIGFHNSTSFPFDEGFKGSGWEDDALCADMKKKFPECKFIIVNDCKLIHTNEMKGNQVNLLQENREYFFKSGRSR